MVEHCDKCGTELRASAPRHQRFLMEDAADESATMEGRLCSDCFWDFKEWLDTK
jgi:hypothetical protein